MQVRKALHIIRNALGRGVFPHHFAFLLDLPIRRLLLHPAVLARRVGLGGRERVLEIGPGSGVYSLTVAAQCGYLVAVDIQPEMLAKVRSRVARRHGSRVACVAGNAVTLPFINASFRTVFMVTVFGEISNRDGLLMEIRRVLEDQGTLSISEHLPDPDFWTSAALVRVVEPHGFEYTGRHGAWWTYTLTFKKRA
jgi:ubiquinone/menaquinone biosynthesis C-methylase UbiE